MTLPLILFTAAWLSWCLLHSLLISGPLARGLARLFPRSSRLVYNLIALCTLLPLLVWERQVVATPVYAWPQQLWPLRAVLLMLALWLVFAAARAFDMRTFLGVAPLEDAESSVFGQEILRTDGILARLRHPWYAAGLILLWLRDQQTYSLVSSILLSVYLVLGALLEERRLLRRFGASYAAYREQVPMFFPRILRKRR